MSKSYVSKIEEVAHHRNGVCGTPFWVVSFIEETGRKMVAVVFDEDNDTGCDDQVAVFDRELLGEGVISFGENSWRGSSYAADLRVAIKKYEFMGRPV